VIVASAVLVLGFSQTKTAILTYHDIIPARNSKSVWFDCTAKEFEDQMLWLKNKGAAFISIRQVADYFKTGKPLPKNAICITFADNYQGFYKFALPVIKRLKIPVAQFVHTDFVGNQTGRPKMTWKQLAEVSRTGLVTVGSQTCSHPPDITKLSDFQLTHELNDSRKAFGKFLGMNVFAFAYPNGKFNRRVADFAQRAGYEVGFTEVCQPLEIAPSTLLIPRYVHTKYKQAWMESKE
jgi:peptidoglycan/xylan/chitin deacetylase (PgdA/CDA1 family)